MNARGLHGHHPQTHLDTGYMTNPARQQASTDEALRWRLRIVYSTVYFAITDERSGRLPTSGWYVRDGTHSGTTVETPHLALYANRSTAADSSCPGVI